MKVKSDMCVDVGINWEHDVCVDLCSV